MLKKFRAISLLLFPIISLLFIYDIFIFADFSRLNIVLLLIFYIVTIFLSKSSSLLSFKVSGLLLIVTTLCAIYSQINIAEKAAEWTFLILNVGIFHSFLSIVNASLLKNENLRYHNYLRKLHITFLNLSSKSWIYIGITFLFQLLALFPYFYKRQILYGEAQFYTSWTMLVDKTNSTWIQYGLGQPAYQGIANTIPIVYIWSILEKLGVPFHTIQYFWFLCLIFLPFLFMFILLIRITKLHPFLIFLISSFYIYNPIFLQQWLSVNPWLMSIYYIIPLYWLVLYISWHNNVRSFLLFLVIFYTSLYIFANPPHLLISLLAIFMASIFFNQLLHNRVMTWYVFRKLLLIYLAFGIINNFVLISFAFNIGSIISSYYSVVDPVEILKLNSAISHPQQVLTMNHLLIPESTFSTLNKLVSIPGVHALLYMPWIMLLVLLTIKKGSKPLFILIGYLTVTFLLIKALNPPFEALYLILFEHIPLFKMFKSIPEKFSSLYIFLLGLVLAIQMQDNMKKYLKPIIVFFIIWISVFTYPLFKKQLIPDINHLGTTFTHFISKPHPLFDTIEFLNSDLTNFNVLSLPGELNYLSIYNYSNQSYLGLNPVTNNIRAGSIEGSHNRGLTRLIYGSFLDQTYTSILPLFNIKYLVLNKKTVNGYGLNHDLTSSMYQEIIGTSIPVVYENEMFKIYKLHKTNERIYIPHTLYNVPTRLELTQLLTGKDTITDGFAISLNSNSVNKYSYSVPKLKFNKINSSHYKVQISRVKETFPLIFTDTFNSDWIIRESDKTNAPHFQANGYSNGWLLNPSLLCMNIKCSHNTDGTFELQFDLVYKPQTVVNTGLHISTIIALFAFILLVIYKRKDAVSS